MGKRQQPVKASPTNEDSKLKSGSSCMICGKTFKYEHKMKIHLRIHTGETPYSCEHCDKSFSQNAALKVHTRTHTGERPFACDSCERRFARADHLRQHIRTHTGEKPYQCSMCDKAFATWSAISRHRSEHLSRDHFVCAFCNKTFSRSDNLRTHLTKTHPETMRPIIPKVEAEEDDSPAEKKGDVADLLHALEGTGDLDHHGNRRKRLNPSGDGEELNPLQDGEELENSVDDEMNIKYEGEEDLQDEEEYSIGPHFLANVLPVQETELSRDVRSKT